MNKELEHYKWMRRVMGISVILLPILPILAGLIGSYNPPNWWNSISATYHTNANGVMVSLLAISAFFFCTYPGYDWRDRVVNFLSGLSLFIIILFPCGDPNLELGGRIGLFDLTPKASANVHNITAFFLFATLFINVRFLFTLSNGEKTEEKEKRNLVYKIASYCIIPTAAIVIVLSIVWPNTFPHWFTLVAEALALIPCGFAWLVKGEAIKALND